MAPPPSRLPVELAPHGRAAGPHLRRLPLPSRGAGHTPCTAPCRVRGRQPRGAETAATERTGSLCRPTCSPQPRPRPQPRPQPQGPRGLITNSKSQGWFIHHAGHFRGLGPDAEVRGRGMFWCGRSRGSDCVTTRPRVLIWPLKGAYGELPAPATLTAKRPHQPHTCSPGGKALVAACPPCSWGTRGHPRAPALDRGEARPPCPRARSLRPGDSAASPGRPRTFPCAACRTRRHHGQQGQGRGQHRPPRGHAASAQHGRGRGVRGRMCKQPQMPGRPFWSQGAESLSLTTGDNQPMGNVPNTLLPRGGALLQPC